MSESSSVPLLTPEGALLFSNVGDSVGDDLSRKKSLSENMSAAVVLTARWNYLATGGTGPEVMLLDW
jgi:hypothetical protein